MARSRWPHWRLASLGASLPRGVKGSAGDHFGRPSRDSRLEASWAPSKSRLPASRFKGFSPPARFPGPVRRAPTVINPLCPPIHSSHADPKVHPSAPTLSTSAATSQFTAVYSGGDIGRHSDHAVTAPPNANPMRHLPNNLLTTALYVNGAQNP